MAQKADMGPVGFNRFRKSMFYAKTDLPVTDEVLVEIRQRTPEQLGLTPEVVERICGSVFHTCPVSVQMMPHQGTFHRLLRFSLPDGRKCVLRANAASEVFRDYALHLDAWIAESLRECELPALAVHHVDTSRSLCPFDYQILEESPDPTLREYDKGPEILEQLDMLGAVTAAVHRIKMSGFGFLDPDPLLHSSHGSRNAKIRGLFDRWEDYLECNLDRHIRICRDIGAISTDEARGITEAFRALAGRLGNVQPRLLHGDLGNHNVFTNGKEITALIDWEDCLAGDPVFDIAFWATFHPEDRHGTFLEGYRSVRDLPGDFPLRFWLYFLRVSLSKTVHRHRFRYADPPGRPPAHGRIRLGLERIRILS